MLTLNLTNSDGDSAESVAEQVRVLQANLGIVVVVDGNTVVPAGPVEVELEPVQPEPVVIPETPVEPVV